MTFTLDGQDLTLSPLLANMLLLLLENHEEIERYHKGKVLFDFSWHGGPSQVAMEFHPSFRRLRKIENA